MRELILQRIEELRKSENGFTKSFVMKKLREIYHNYRLNNHTCEKNLKVIERYRVGFASNGCTAETTVAMCKCEICGKRVDID